MPGSSFDGHGQNRTVSTPHLAFSPANEPTSSEELNKFSWVPGDRPTYLRSHFFSFLSVGSTYSPGDGPTTTA